MIKRNKQNYVKTRRCWDARVSVSESPRPVRCIRRRVERQKPGAARDTGGQVLSCETRDRARVLGIRERSVEWGPGCGRDMLQCLHCRHCSDDRETWHPWHSLLQIHADIGDRDSDKVLTTAACCIPAQDISGVLSDIANCNRVCRVITDWSHSRYSREKWVARSRRPRIKALDLITHIKCDLR